jgi:hypothetical protein
MTQGQLDHYSKLGSLVAGIVSVVILGFLVVYLGFFHGGSDAAPAEPITPKPTAPTPPPPPPPPPAPKADVWNAIGRIQFGNAGCTATIIGPRRADGRWDVLTANHCIEGQPTVGAMRLRDGREFQVRLVGRAKGPDAAWLITDEKNLDLPFAFLADNLPSKGDKIFHGGFGVHVPGNREEGSVVVPDNGDGQTQFRLSVSSGDSGGGICITAEGKVLSCVCCTTAKGQMADVWGANVNEIRKLRGQVSDVWPQWNPIDVPVKTIPLKMEEP